MLDNTLTFDFGAKTGLVLVKRNEAGGVTSYGVVDGDDKFDLTVKHVPAPRGETGEFHQIRLDVTDQTGGTYNGAESVWINIKSLDKAQDNDRMADAIDSLEMIQAIASFVTRVLNQES